MNWRIFLILVCYFLFLPEKTYAIIPPDFAMNVATQGSQLFTYIVLFGSVVFVVTWQFIKNVFSSKKVEWIVFFLIIIGLFIGINYGYSYYRNYQNRQVEKIDIYRWGKKISLPLSESQKKTYTDNKKAIDTFITSLDWELQPWMKNVTIVFLNDLNSYLQINHRSSLSVSNIELVEKPEKEAILLDVRDDYERKFVKLKGVKVIRLGNLVNNEFDGLQKDNEIIVLCHTDARSFIVANYLKSQGFINVKGYKGGVISWLENKQPIVINKPFQFIYSKLPLLSIQEVKRLKNSDNNVEELVFAPDSEYSNAIHSLFMSDTQLSNFIATLSPHKKYIIHCVSNDHCFDAVSFLDKVKTKNKNLQFIGYYGYSLPSK